LPLSGERFSAFWSASFMEVFAGMQL